jgi:hypothetical protein
MVIRKQPKTKARRSESDQSQNYHHQKTIKCKGMRLESEQNQRDSDEKAMKGKCIVIIKGPKAKA